MKDHNAYTKKKKLKWNFYINIFSFIFYFIKQQNNKKEIYSDFTENNGKMLPTQYYKFF